MSWLADIATCPRIQVYSQNGEEGPLFFILEKLGLLDQKDLLVVDLGAGNGRDLSNACLLMERGWHGRLVDMDPKGATEVIGQKITMHNAGTFALGCNVLLIDIDGNDFWVMDGALRTSFVCEINTKFARTEVAVIKYDPDRTWDGTDGYGMSIEAAIRLGAKHGYSPVHLHNNQNLFLVRNDLLPDGELPELVYRQDTITHPHSETAQWVQFS